ncbi:uncharacterized mitochondrial protein AtMg00860-like [Hibiscus syriacus]|uniref:uncharacterized mitochondrial protein AtMg00860-like n=1 Tax=Hibiscus syriacus TaxID=106335 RepID=UPI001921E998|nr:uncharacterized mitochondrial protein AtMg00860-like [Hibiscus syriacus]
MIGGKHDLHLRIILHVLRKKKLYAKFLKCEFWLSEIEFLVHVVLTDLNKMKVIVEWKLPKNVTKFHSFLGLTGYYLHFVEGFFLIVALLTRLLQKNDRFEWTEDRKSSFEKLKSVLTEALVLVQPKSGKDFLVFSDASIINLEFAYNNSYQTNIQMAPIEALYECKCRTPFYWSELSQRRIVGLNLLQDTKYKVKFISKHLKVAFDQQKSYVNLKNRKIEYVMGDLCS